MEDRRCSGVNKWKKKGMEMCRSERGLDVEKGWRNKGVKDWWMRGR